MRNEPLTFNPRTPPGKAVRSCSFLKALSVVTPNTFSCLEEGGGGGGRMTCGDGGVTAYVYIICSNLKSLNKQQAVLFHSAPDASPSVASAQT